MKQQERQAHSRNEILKAALSEFGAYDYGQVSVESICKKHNISKGMMYHYYSGKDELFLLCVEDTFRVLKNHVEQNMRSLSGYDTPEQIKRFFLLREYFFQQHPERKNIFEIAMLHPPEHLRVNIQLLREPLRRLNADFLRQAVETMPLRPGLEREQAARYLESMEAVFSDMLLRYQAGAAPHDVHALMKSAGEALDLLLFGVIQQNEQITLSEPEQK